MSRSLDTLLRPSLLAVAIALCTPLASSQLIAAEQASSVRPYNLPAASLASTLNQIASQSGVALSLNPSLVAGKTSAPVSGQYDAIGALRAALRGTGLQLEQSGTGTYSLVAAPEGDGAAGNERYWPRGIRKRLGSSGRLCGYPHRCGNEDRHRHRRSTTFHDGHYPRAIGRASGAQPQ